MTRPPAVIFDVDGTLVDVSSVRHHVLTRPKRFDRFHDGALDCPPHDWVVAAAQVLYEAGVGILVVTARSEEWSMHTLLWLAEHNVRYDELHMRPRRDQRRDYLVKADILAGLRRRWDVRLAFDDNPSVLALWHEHDIPTVTVPGWLDDPHDAAARTAHPLHS